MEYVSAELDTIKNLVSGHYPNYSDVLKSKKLTEGWSKVISSLESRLVLLDVIYGSKWLKGPKMPPLNKSKVLSINEIEQSIMLIDNHILKAISSQAQLSKAFPLKEILSNLLEFKTAICVDPAFKLMFEMAHDALVHGVVLSYPEVLSHGKGDKRDRLWYHHYGVYGSLLNLLHFDSKSKERLSVSPDFWGVDDSLILMMYSYAYKSSSSKEQWAALLSNAEAAAKEMPSLVTLNTAMQAFGKMKFGIKVP